MALLYFQGAVQVIRSNFLSNKAQWIQATCAMRGRAISRRQSVNFFHKRMRWKIIGSIYQAITAGTALAQKKLENHQKEIAWRTKNAFNSNLKLFFLGQKRVTNHFRLQKVVAKTLLLLLLFAWAGHFVHSIGTQESFIFVCWFMPPAYLMTLSSQLL